MADPFDVSVRLIAASEQKAASVGRNIANSQVSGYRAEKLIVSNLTPVSAFSLQAPDFDLFYDDTAGNLSVTDRALDLALESSGFFKVLDQETGAEYLTRAGHFNRAYDGTLQNSNGFALLDTNGGVIRTVSDKFQVLQDGSLFENEEKTAQIGVFAPAPDASINGVSGSLFSSALTSPMAPYDVKLLQGALESSNVELGQQMIALMQSVREAETGARLIQTYDAMLGKAISTFG